MIKIFAVFAILTVMISTASVYNLKQATEDLEEKKRDIAEEILNDREAIKVLRAEMAYLSRPERLERLSRRHLALNATQTEQLETDISVLSVRDNVQMASLPIDNFQLLLPRQKPDPRAIVRVNQTRSNKNVSVVAKAEIEQKQQGLKTEQEVKQEPLSLYERILAKIGN